MISTFFKEINDKYGHDVGDKVLVELSGYMKASLDDTMLLGRLGGEEFAIVMPGYDADAAFAIVEQIRDGVSRHEFTSNKGSFSVTISCGISTLNDESSIDKLLMKADEGLYGAKKEGRNKSKVFCYRI